MKRSRILVCLALVALAAAFFYRHSLLRVYYGVKNADIIRSESKIQGVSPHLVAAVIFTESHFRTKANSEVGAMGLMQLMPETASEMALNEKIPDFEVDDLYRPEVNIRLGTRYLRELLDRFPSEEQALAAYNAGPTRVDEWNRTNSGIVYRETQAYVKNVLRHRKALKMLYPDWASPADRDS